MRSSGASSRSSTSTRSLGRVLTVSAMPSVEAQTRRSALEAARA